MPGNPDLDYLLAYQRGLGDPFAVLHQPGDYTGRRGGPVAADSSSHEAFLRSTYPVALEYERQTGIPAALLQAITASESNWGKAPGNELFGIKGPGQRLATYEVVNGVPRQSQESFKSYPTVTDAYRDFVGLVTSGRYAPAYQQFTQDHDAETFLRGVNAAGYATDPMWADKVVSIAQHQVQPVQAALASGRTGDENLVPNQLSDRTLTPEESYSACGPAAAVAFARATGREPTLREALDLAKKYGWTTGGGMNGAANQLQLLKAMGVPSHLETAVDWAKVQHDATTGNPVIISTPGHFFVTDAYDAQSGKFHVGNSGRVLKNGGGSWMTADQMQTAQGRVNGALYLDNPLSGARSIAAGGDWSNPVAGPHPYYGANFSPDTPEEDDDATSEQLLDWQRQSTDDATQNIADNAEAQPGAPRRPYGRAADDQAADEADDAAIPFEQPQQPSDPPLGAVPQAASFEVPSEGFGAQFDYERGLELNTNPLLASRRKQRYQVPSPTAFALPEL